MSVMVDPRHAEARSSPGETPSRFMSTAGILLLLLLLDALLRIDARTDSHSPMQLPRSDHRDGRVAISVHEFGAKGNGLDDDTAVSTFPFGDVGDRIGPISSMLHCCSIFFFFGSRSGQRSQKGFNR